MIEFTLKGEIPVKKNSYRIGRNGGLYRPDRVTDWEANAQADILEQRVPKLAGKFLVHIIVYFSRPRDLDGAVTTILDVLQASGVIDNDKNVYELIAKKVKNKKPGALIQIELI